MNAQTALRSSLWLALGGWVGAWGFFAFVVSRIAFQVLPGDVAGDLAGELLAILHYGGAGAAFVVAGAGFALGRRGWVITLPIALGLICLASEFFLSPAVAEVRPSARLAAPRTSGPPDTGQAELVGSTARHRRPRNGRRKDCYCIGHHPRLVRPEEYHLGQARHGAPARIRL